MSGGSVLWNLHDEQCNDDEIGIGIGIGIVDQVIEVVCFV